MKLGRLFVAEIGIVVLILIVIIVVVEVNPTLAGTSESAPIGAFNQKVYAQDTLVIYRGEAASATFDYSSSESAVLVIDLTFTDIQSSGYLTMESNGRYIGTIYASADSPQASISAISFASAEWVKPPSQYSDAFTNQVIFSSDSENGYEGSFQFQISLKGSQ